MIDVAVIALLAWLAGANSKPTPEQDRLAGEVLGMVVLSLIATGVWIAFSYFAAAHGIPLGDLDMRPEAMAARMIHHP